MESIAGTRIEKSTFTSAVSALGEDCLQTGFISVGALQACPCSLVSSKNEFICIKLNDHHETPPVPSKGCIGTLPRGPLKMAISAQDSRGISKNECTLPRLSEIMVHEGSNTTALSRHINLY